MNEIKREKTIVKDNPLDNKKILVVDDEADVLESLLDQLSMCHLTTAQTFEHARDLIETEQFDIAILDIMGVKGYDLLKITNRIDIPALMLTAHALTPENLKESIVKGADSYIPKDELANLVRHVADVIKARIEGRQGYGAWFRNLKPFFDKAFGKDWRDRDRNFWNSFDDKYGR